MRTLVLAVVVVAVARGAAADPDRLAVRRAIRPHLDAMVRCYARALEARPELPLDATFTARFVIATDGRISSIRVRGPDAGAARCIRAVIRAIEFPAPRGGKLTVSYPFHFDPVGR